jgi:hypothetical protein
MKAAAMRQYVVVELGEEKRAPRLSEIYDII